MFNDSLFRIPLRLFYSVVFILLLLKTFSANSQFNTLRIYCEVDSTALRKNNIKSIVEFRYDKTSKVSDTAAIYRVNSKGEITYYCYAYFGGITKEWMVQRIEENAGDHSRSLITGKMSKEKDSVIIFNSKTHYYSSKDIVYHSIERSIEGNEIIYDYQIDTTNKDISLCNILTLDGKDTVRLINYEKNGVKDVYSVIEKRKGLVTYEEQQYTFFRNGKFSLFQRIINNVLVSEYGPENNQKFKGDSLDYGENPLPYSDTKRVDSTYINYLQAEIIPPGTKQNNKRKFLKLEHYVSYERDKPVATDLYYSNGLIYINNNTNEKFLTLYTYLTEPID
jgi:hypothetical protein